MQGIIPQSTPDEAFKQFYLKDDLIQTKTIILISCFFISLLSYGDYLNFGFNSTFYSIVCTRATFLLYSVIILRVLTHVQTARQHDYLIFLWAASFMFLTLYVNISRPETNIRFSYIDPLIVLTIFVFFPSNVCIQVILTSILTIGDLGIIWFFKSLISELAFKTIALSYILSNVLGMFIAFRLRQFRQKQYSSFLQEQNSRKELEQIAFIDYLTGALNRRKFFQLGILELKRFKYSEKPFSVIMLDLDFFKNLNDEFGHAAGDNYLKEFTKTIIQNKRSNDILGRLGGEEFALLLPDTNLEAALELAERLRQVCEADKIYFNNQLVRTTVSMGVTSAWEKDRTLQDVLKRADAALYHAKRKGRNQVQSCLEVYG